MLNEIRLGDIVLLTSVYEHINSNMYVKEDEDEKESETENIEQETIE